MILHSGRNILYRFHRKAGDIDSFPFFVNPFSPQVHPLAATASEQLQAMLTSDRASQIGEMFAVLVVIDQHGHLGFLCATNTEESRHLIDFVPSLSKNELLLNIVGESIPISQFFNQTQFTLGMSNCSIVKLLQFSFKNDLKPLAYSQFWWGASPDSEVRRHGYFYPASRSCCEKVLSFMLKGLEVGPLPLLGANIHDKLEPYTIYEDEYLAVVNKPSGLLSVPGKEVADSVLTRLRQRYPKASGPLLVHRLDLATSGLMLAAKNKDIHKALQKQFIQREVKKKYVAILSDVELSQNKHGVIKLPLRVDINDRPRQLVCYSHGKPAVTRWELVSSNSGHARVNFFPLTGRTHQLRVHAAHKDGLNAPIVGDSLYGAIAERLMLHAEQLSFSHPMTGQLLQITSEAEF